MVHPAESGKFSEGLQRELERRKRYGEVEFEYFAPTLVEAKEVKGRIVCTKTPLLLNYLFVRASESEIYKIKQFDNSYNFLRRVIDDDGGYHYPYVSEDIIRTLRWIEMSYSGILPVYTADTSWLIKGDRIRITSGQFMGVEANIVKRPASNQKEVMVVIDNWMNVPLINVKVGDYEIVALSNKQANRKTYSKLDNEKVTADLHDALCRFHKGQSTNEDKQLASKLIQEYENLSVDSDVMRCKLYALLFQAYTILQDVEKIESLYGIIRLLLPVIKAEQSRALIIVTLYGCMNSSIYYNQAHELLASWKKEASPKKSKLQLLQHLEDFDNCFKH